MVAKNRFTISDLIPRCSCNNPGSLLISDWKRNLRFRDIAWGLGDKTWTLWDKSPDRLRQMSEPFGRRDCESWANFWLGKMVWHEWGMFPNLFGTNVRGVWDKTPNHLGQTLWKKSLNQLGQMSLPIGTRDYESLANFWLGKNEWHDWLIGIFPNFVGTNFRGVWDRSPNLLRQITKSFGAKVRTGRRGSRGEIAFVFLCSFFSRSVRLFQMSSWSGQKGERAGVKKAHWVGSRWVLALGQCTAGTGSSTQPLDALWLWPTAAGCRS